MTHHTEAERAKREDFEQWSISTNQGYDLTRNQTGCMRTYEKDKTEHAWRGFFYGMQAARRAPAVPVPQDVEKLLAELTEEIEATDNWRRLALQFDGHRMQAIGHLKAMLTDPKGSEANALEFIKAAPLNGEAVLAQRIAALAAAPQPPEKDKA